MNIRKGCLAVLLYMICLPQLGLADPSAQDYFNHGNKLYSEKKYEDARRYFEYAIQLEPNSWRASQSLGVVLLKLGNNDEAIKAFERALKINPKNTKLQAYLDSIKDPQSTSIDNQASSLTKRPLAKKSGVNRKKADKKFFISLSVGPGVVSAKQTYEYDLGLPSLVTLFGLSDSSFGIVTDVRLGWKNKKNWEIAFIEKGIIFSTPYLLPASSFPGAKLVEGDSLWFAIIGMGIKKYLGKGQKGPFAGIGLGFAIFQPSGDDPWAPNGFGLAVEGGYRISRRFEFGGDLMWSQTSADNLDKGIDGTRYKVDLIAARTFVTFRLI